MVDYGESDKMIKISGKVNKSNIYSRFTGYILFFIHRISSDQTFPKLLKCRKTQKMFSLKKFCE